MTISAELQQRYQTEVDVDWWEAVIFNHATAGALYLVNSEDGQVRRGSIDGAVREFIPIPFVVSLPERSGDGQQDLGITVGNIGKEMTIMVENAMKAPENPIRFRYTIFIEGNTTPQINPPFELTLTDVMLTQKALTGTATRYQVFNRSFPNVVYKPSEWPGLVRR